MWSLYWQLGGHFEEDNYVNMSAVLFMWCVLPAYGAASYVPSIVMERTLYVRERADGLYLPVTYLVAKMLDELILATICSIIFAAATFYGARATRAGGSSHVAGASRSLSALLRSHRVPGLVCALLAGVYSAAVHWHFAGVLHLRRVAQHGDGERGPSHIRDVLPVLWRLQCVFPMFAAASSH